MPGIEKMTEAILAEANNEAQSIIAKAQSEIDEKKVRDDSELKEAAEKAKASLEKELSDYRQRAESARDLSRRRMILAKKQEIIQDIVEKIRLSLHESEPRTYFSHIYKMFEKYCRPEDGTMVLNAQDLNRIPGDFEERITQIAKSKGGSIKILKDAADIEDGFVLTYGGTEENCTFRSLIESGKEDLYDEINRMLWR